MSDPESFAERY